MRIRRQLAVASPLTAANIAGATIDVAAHREPSQQVRTTLAGEFGASEVLLTDSGTSALVLALRALAKPELPVAMPAYACVDLVAAARRAGVRVRLFDVDPHTLSPDMDSLRRVVAAGVSAIIVAHLYGFPADMPAVMTLARAAGAPVIEDAAQQAGATIGGTAAGSFGDLTVLSFGRGKGTTSGRGGALLSNGHGDVRVALLPSVLERGRSSGVFVTTVATWALGRPSIYRIPASIPALHLGETVYRDAGEPRSMSRVAVALLERTLPGMHAAARARQSMARLLRDTVEQLQHLDTVRAVETGEPGYLRFPVLLRNEASDNDALGVARGYPKPLSLEPETQPCLVSSSEPLRGAHELARRLVTLPTHHMVTTRDLEHLATWLRSA